MSTEDRRSIAARGRLGWAAIGAALALLAAASATAEWVDWIAEADLAFRYDSNLNNAVFGGESEYDLAWRPAARLGRAYQVAETTRLSALAEVRGDVHHRFSNLDAVAGGGELALFHKFGLGDAPWARVFAEGGYAAVRDSERSGPFFDTGAQIGKRFSPRLDASVTYQFTVRDGDEGRSVVPGSRTDVWDQEFHEISVDGRFLVTEALLATAGYEFHRGDLYSNSGARRTLVTSRADVEAVADENVFGGWAFRLFGNAHSPFVSLNYGLGDHWSIDASYRFRYAESESLSFTNHIAQLMVSFTY